ncbi:MAG: Guanylate kinase [Candidatus Scalindua arabica]|uniref:Guanylate kinase n=1 Tax=Candidatus Scalindua arabica TaxID=1127984 RepID=A0A942A4E7_9BACT|nr:Guanylate kinase [Candidatus Scalindua arabica]
MLEDSIIGEGEKGKLVIISGPSGSGKTSICKILTKNPKVKQSVSYTTRKPRDGERDGIDYCFIDKSEFEKLIEEDKFIEYAEYCGYLYGTSISTIKEAIENDEILILAIDVKGALQVIDKMPEAISIFINTPDDETLKHRLKNRLTDDDSVINERFVVAKEEMEYSKHYDYCVINDRLDDAVKEIEGILNIP